MALPPYALDINLTNNATTDDNFTMSENTTDYPRGYTDHLTYDLWNLIYDNDTSYNDSFPEAETVYPGAGFPSGYSWPTVIISTCFIVILVILVGLGNGLVCIAIYTDKNLKITQNAFIASLAVADMLLGLVVMPFSWCNEMMGYWFFGNIWCDLWLSIDVLLCTASILNLVLISLDRYWSITRALHYPQQRTPKRAAIMIAIVWILSGIICLPPLIGWKQPRTEITTKYPICFLSEDIGYVLYSSCGSFYIPMVIMVIVYFRIYLAARNRARGSLTKTKVVCPDNIKDKSTSSTTTSFTTPPKNNNQKSMNVTTTNATSVTPNANAGGGGGKGGRKGAVAIDDDKESSFSDEDAVPVTHDNSLKVPSRDRTHQQFLQTTEDEQRKLLPTDSDSMSVDNRLRTATSDSEVGEIRPPIQRLVLVTDTESSVESPKRQLHQGDVSTELETVEENAKPLLAVDTDSTCFDSPYLSPETQMTDTGTTTEVKTPSLGRRASNHINQQSPQQQQNQTNSQPHNQTNQIPHGEDNNHTTQYAGPTPTIIPSPSLKEKDANHKKHKKEKSKTKKKKEHIPMINFKKCHKKTDKDNNRKEQTWKAPSARDTEKHKRRIAKARERRATIVLGIVMAAFILCWCPFFTLYVVSAFCHNCIPDMVFDIFFWIGYCNSALNPVIYTVFNRDFKHAFIKILFGSKYARRH